MMGSPIQEVNAGVSEFIQYLNLDETARKRVELCVITFGPVTVRQDFTVVENVRIPSLDAQGETPLGEALSVAVDRALERRVLYRQNGIGYYPPWIVLMTDGDPTDQLDHARERLKAAMSEAKVQLFSFAAGNAATNAGAIGLLKSLGGDTYRLNGVQYREVFRWLSESIAFVSRSAVGSDVRPRHPGKLDGILE